MGGLGKLAGLLCFPGDTPVQMADAQDGSGVSSKKQRSGLVRHAGASAARSGQSSAKSARASSRVKPISQIRVGDLVASRDEATGKLVTGKVTATSKRVAFELYEVSLADAATGKVVERIRATREHPFYVVGKGWVAARYLGVGNSLVTRAGPIEAGGSGLVVSGLKRSFHSQGIPVYNFEVASTHSYFVGRADNGSWVHNYISVVPIQRGKGILSDISGLKSIQDQVSGTKIDRWRLLMENGRFDWDKPITVHKGMIMEGHHRYIAASMTGNLEKLKMVNHPKPEFADGFLGDVVEWGEMTVLHVLPR